MPGASVRYLYLPCDDLPAMRRFYGELIGLDEIWFGDGMVAFDCGGLQFTVFECNTAERVVAGWARQPGWEGGEAAAVSWSAEMTAESFAAAVGRLGTVGVDARWPEPRWVGYWSFPVRDPMGNTVELTHPSDTEPDPDATWRTALT